MEKHNYEFLVSLLKDMKELEHITFETKQDANGNRRKLVVYNDLTYFEVNLAIDPGNVLISELSAKDFNELEKEFSSCGYTKRTN